MNAQLSDRIGWHWLGLLLILGTAVFLRLTHITEVPPGLTHDEADHGITALGILQGEGGIYFTVGHGREPLYDYATAAVMVVLGPTYLAGRLTAVFFSLFSIVGLYAWVQQAFDRTTALLAAAGLSVSFWGIMAARQSLRSITLPALFVMALAVWWAGNRGQEATGVKRGREGESTIFHSLFIMRYVLSGLLLGVTFYTYIPARAMWLLFPAVLGYLAVVDRERFLRLWKGTAVMLLTAFLIALPLILFLLNNPELEVRIAELSGPLTAARQGDFSLLWQNAMASLRLFTLEGDSAWRYNIPGKPLLSLLPGSLFYVGVLLAGWWTIRPLRTQSTPQQKQRGTAAFTALAWLLLGFAPVLVTGPALSMTQAVGMQPVLYLFPALVLGYGMGVLGRGERFGINKLLPVAYSLFLFLFYGVIAFNSVRDYFGTWANAPEVRVQYESTMAAAMNYVNENQVSDVAISTITPGEFHTPALAQMMLTNTAVTPRWYDGRTSLLLPQTEESVIIVPGFTPMHPALARYTEGWEPVMSLPLRQSDLDRPLSIFAWQADAALAAWQPIFTEPDAPINFGHKLRLLGWDIQTPVVTAGNWGQVATLWQILEPIPVDTQLFTHVLGANGVPVAQQDKLDVPAESWVPGDYFIQLHEFWLEEDTAVQVYPISVGVYTCPESCDKGERLPVWVAGISAGDSFTIESLEVIE